MLAAAARATRAAYDPLAIHGPVSACASVWRCCRAGRCLCVRGRPMPEPSPAPRGPRHLRPARADAARRPPPQPARPAARLPVRRGRPRPASAGLALRIETGRRGSGTVERVDLEAYVRDVVVGELSVGPADGALAAPRIRGAGDRRPHLCARRARPACGRRLRPVLDDALPGVRARSVEAQPVGDRDRRAPWRARAGAISPSAARPIEAVFHAHCGGHTSAAAEVWRSAGAPYLRGVDDPYCLREQPAEWSVVADLETLRVALNQRPRTVVGERLDGVQVLRRDERWTCGGGRAARARGRRS